MGASSSKAARTAGASARKYPTRSPPNATTRAPVASAPPPQAARANPAPAPAPGPTVHPPVEASDVKTESIDADAKDPALVSRLSTLGAVQPNPHYSPTSRSQFDPQPRRPSEELLGDMMGAPPQSSFPDPRHNPVLRIFSARQKIQDEAEEDITLVGRRGFAGRKYVDAGTIQLAMMRQLRGEPNSRIEEALGIKKGRMNLVGKGTVAPINDEV